MEKIWYKISKAIEKIKIVLLLIVVLNNSITIAQNYDQPLDTFPNYSNSSYFQAMKSSHIHLIGEFHYWECNSYITISYLTFLNKLNIYPKIIFREEGAALSELRNIYLETGDKLILEIMGLSPLERYEIDKYRNYYLGLESENKFKFIGVDSESSLECLHYFIRSLVSNSKLAVENEYLPFAKVFNSFLDKPNPRSWSKKYLKKDINEIISILNGSDSLKLRKLLTLKLNNVINSYNLELKSKHFFYCLESSKFKIERERFMANGIYNEFIKDSDSYYFGQFGMAHVVLSTQAYNADKFSFFVFGSMLNHEKKFTLTNENIISSIIYYGRRTKVYRHFGVNISNLRNKYSKVESKNYLLSKEENNTFINNFIFYKKS